MKWIYEYNEYKNYRHMQNAMHMPKEAPRTIPNIAPLPAAAKNAAQTEGFTFRSEIHEVGLRNPNKLEYHAKKNLML